MYLSGVNSEAKNLTDFVLFPPNLIEGEPFVFGYVIHGSDRAVQTRDFESLKSVIKSKGLNIKYLKTDKSEHFLPLSAHEDLFKDVLSTKLIALKRELSKSIIYTPLLVFLLFLLGWCLNEIKPSFIWVSVGLGLYNVLFSFVKLMWFKSKYKAYSF